MARNWSLVSFGKSFFTPAGRQAAANFAWMLAGRIISQTCLVGVILLLTRALGREQFGIFATALALQGYIVLLATAGMPAVVVREAVRRPGEVAQIASTFLAVAWTVGLFAALVLCVVALFMNISAEEKLLLVSFPAYFHRLVKRPCGKRRQGSPRRWYPPSGAAHHRTGIFSAGSKGLLWPGAFVLPGPAMPVLAGSAIAHSAC